MSALTKILTGAAGLAAAVGFASPAAAQYYPGYPYGGNQGVVGAIINSVIGNQYGQNGYGQYGYGQGNQQYAVNQCSRAVEARLGGQYRGYNQGYGAYGYNQGYAGGRVVQVTRVERRSSGTRVRGLASSGAGYGYGGYGYNGGADLSFSCKVDYRGRITDIDLDRRNTAYYRGY
jgi:hypothetical protein